MKRLLPLGLFALLLAGCAGTNNNTLMPSGSTQHVNQNQIDTSVQSQLEQAADSVQSSLQTLAAIEKLQDQSNITIPFSGISDPVLNKLIEINWYGPIQGLLSKVASSTGYKLQVFGKPPSLPVLVNINTIETPASAINIIRNADLQGGLKIAILIFPDQKIISLRYTES